MPTPRILHIIDSLTIGGAEKLLISIIQSLKGYEQHLIYLGGSDALLPELPPNCEVLKLNSKSKWDLPRCIFKVGQYIKKNKIDIVHSHLVLATLVARVGCPGRVKLFNTLHSLVGSRFFGKGKKVQRIVEKATYKKRHYIIAVSEEVLRDYDRIIGIKGPFSILPNFIDNKYLNLEFKKSNFTNNLRLITVGNLKPAKNYFYLLEAFKHLPSNIQLDIYGEGPLRNELQAVIDTNKLNIRLCGAISNIHEIITNYDVFIMSSSFEGHPLALLEAMACGMPTAMSDIPVLRQITGNKGIYFDLNNNRDLVNKIMAIANHTIPLDDYAKHNFELSKKAVTKSDYIIYLNEIYGNLVTAVT